jgi:hypothetical protein
MKRHVLISLHALVDAKALRSLAADHALTANVNKGAVATPVRKSTLFSLLLLHGSSIALSHRGAAIKRHENCEGLGPASLPPPRVSLPLLLTDQEPRRTRPHWSIMSSQSPYALFSMSTQSQARKPCRTGPRVQLHSYGSSSARLGKISRISEYQQTIFIIILAAHVRTSADTQELNARAD